MHSKSNSTSSSNATQTVTAACDAGQVATGGGAEISNPSQDYLAVNAPVFTNGVATGWTATAAKSNGSGSYTLTTYVLCAPAS
jgi:hypothetical protein